MHIAAAWLITGAIFVAIGEFKSTSKAKGSWGWCCLGFLIMALAATAGF